MYIRSIPENYVLETEDGKGKTKSNYLAKEKSVRPPPTKFYALTPENKNKSKPLKARHQEKKGGDESKCEDIINESKGYYCNKSSITDSHPYMRF